MKPFLFLISLSAPFLNNNLRTRKLPEIAARWEGVSPSLFCLLTSAGGSCSSKYFIISKLPLAALRCNKVFPLSSTSLIELGWFFNCVFISSKFSKDTILEILVLSRGVSIFLLFNFSASSFCDVSDILYIKIIKFYYG